MENILGQTSREVLTIIKNMDADDTDVRRHKAKCTICNSQYCAQMDEMILNGAGPQEIREFLLSKGYEKIEDKTYYLHRRWIPYFVAERLTVGISTAQSALIEQHVRMIISSLEADRAIVVDEMWTVTIPTLLSRITELARSTTKLKDVAETLDIILKAAQLIEGRVTNITEVRTVGGENGGLPPGFKDPSAKLEALRRINPAFDVIDAEFRESKVGDTEPVNLR